MKFFCKLTNTKLAFTVELQCDTFQHLKNAVAVNLASVERLRMPDDGGMCRVPVPFFISLNGKKELIATEETPLTDLGLVSGDILRVIIDKEYLMALPLLEIKEMPPEINNSRFDVESTMLCCESEGRLISSSLLREYCSNNVRNEQDALVIALHVLLCECGFVKRYPNQRVSSTGGMYTLCYSHSACPEFFCNLMCTAFQKTLAVNAIHVVREEQQEWTKVANYVTLNHQLYVAKKSDYNNTDIADVYENLRHLSTKIKSFIADPLLQALAEFYKYEGKGFMDMPTEIQFQIFKNLDLDALKNVSAVCSQLYQLSNAQSLWKRLYQRNFSSVNHPDAPADFDWKQRYKESYSQKKRRDYCRYSSGLPRPMVVWGPEFFQDNPDEPLIQFRFRQQRRRRRFIQLIREDFPGH